MFGCPRQRRFLQVLDQLDDAMIGLLADSVDGVHHIAPLLVVLPPGGEEEPAGVARLPEYPDDPATADIAVTVLTTGKDAAPASHWSRR